MKKLVLSIFLMTMSLSSFSQTATDTSSIQLRKPIAKLVIKDLIIGDGSKEQISILNAKIGLLENKIVLKDSIIFNLNTKVTNYESILNVKGDQLALSQELSKKLEKDLSKAKLKGKLVGGAGLLLAAGAAILLK
jgi:hypothetical protein